ncbi:uncharacterized protein BJ171DRAFT_513469 [Polychytrium aggregatum]|uniref:uncharacterized protein n=1 Tax=Polychytrium aggregatum TaxID=110093 RepID=UPI0022FE7574|nr:uncharacterized protein BJ171DRAFT_513469 [Polychytrium aggregatum]KAI9202583.1 hypothetical protein BJ171DRAFT_513469 [Polychytrium aggregatum]
MSRRTRLRSDASATCSVMGRAQTTPLAQIKKKCAEKVQGSEDNVRLYFDGDLIDDEQSAQDLDMEDGDQIQAKLKQS